MGIPGPSAPLPRDSGMMSLLGLCLRLRTPVLVRNCFLPTHGPLIPTWRWQPFLVYDLEGGWDSRFREEWAGKRPLGRELGEDWDTGS